MKILGIESSCDETACAIVEDGKHIISNVVATQIPFHQVYNGVVPEIASRKHAEWILPVVKQALSEANLTINDIDGIAATNRPGLMGSLLVGLTFGKTLAWSTGKPFVAVNHMLGHLYAANLVLPGQDDLMKDVEYPYLGLLVSGGHSIICKVSDFDKIEVLGTTIDDAVGEAFDKVARAIGLGYPGGPKIDKLSKEGNPNAIVFPKAKMEDGPLDFSFSGVKSAVLNHINRCKMQGEEICEADIAASFQKSVVDTLVEKAVKAAKEHHMDKLAIAGGVASNGSLREAMRIACEKENITFYYPSPIYCTDNAAMIGVAAYYEYLKGTRHGLDLNAVPNLKLGER